MLEKGSWGVCALRFTMQGIRSLSPFFLSPTLVNPLPALPPSHLPQIRWMDQKTT